jgi:hypothetical protein
MPPHLLALVISGIILHRHARAVLAYAGDLDSTSGDARPDRPGERRAPHRRGEDDGYSQDSRHARDRADRARNEMGSGRSSIMRCCGIRGISFREAAEELKYNDEGLVCEQFKLACIDLLSVYSEFDVENAQPRLPQSHEVEVRSFPAVDGTIFVELYECVRLPEEARLRAFMAVERWKNLTVDQYLAIARERGLGRLVRAERRRGEQIELLAGEP